MSQKIIIGADEIILWLRKNDKAQNVSNDEIQGLGVKIHRLIVNELGGRKVSSDTPSYWANLMDDRNIEKFNLPKTASQYEIDTTKIGDLYENIFTW